MSLSENAELALRLVREAPLICFDVETTGVDWRKNSIVGYVITADERRNCYVPIRHGGGGNLGDAEPIETAESTPVPHPWEAELSRAFFERKQRRSFVTVGHNIKFDAHFAANHGVELGRNIECTQINEAIVNEHALSYSLDACCKRHHVTEKKGEELYVHLAGLFGCKPDRSSMAHYWRVAGDDPIATDYALGDGVSTLALRGAQVEFINRADPQGFDLSYIHRLENDLISTVFRLERRGMKIDEARLAAVRSDIASMVAEASKSFPEGFNVRSTAQVKAWLEDQGVKEFVRTAPSKRFPDGQVSITQKWLTNHPLGKDIVDVRMLLDLTSKFIDPLEQRHLFKGRVHASLNQMKADDFGTITGRFSSSEPNLQQVPKRNKKLGRLFRSVFIPDDDMEFYEGDYSQAEPRMFAHYTQAEHIMNGYKQTPFVDMHQVLADALKVERDPTAKRMNMGLLTGMYPQTFSQHMGWTLQEATEKWEWYNGTFFPELKAFHDSARTVYKERGFVRTLLGRRCRLNDYSFAYQAVSRIIQGGQADIIKDKLRQADRMCEENGDVVQLLMTVHDSFVWQAPKTAEAQRLVDEMTAMIDDVQCEPYNLRVPFLLEVGHGPNWAIATYGEPK